MLRTALRNVLAHKTRLIMTVLAVCLGVAFISGSLVFADSTTAAYRAAMSRNYADIDVSVGPKSVPGASADEQYGALDDALVRKLSAVPGVASVRPTAGGSVTLAAKDGTPMRADTMGGKLGVAYVPGSDGQDSRYPLTSGRAPRDSGEVALDRGTAAAAGYSLGDTVTLATEGPVLTMRLVGLVSTTDSRVNAGGTLAVFDKATAQKLFAAPGHYSGMDLTAVPGTDQFELANRVGAVLPADRAEATTATAQADQQSVFIAGKTKSFERLPLLFAVVSLFIGTFLIVNTFTMLVARRSREIALLRAIGATRRQVVRSVLAEAALVGLAASAVGFVLGLGVATVLPNVLDTSGDLLPSGPLVIGPAAILASLAVGVGVTVLAAWLPSRRAARIAPVEAMRTAEQPPSATLSRIRGAVGLAMVVLGVGLLLSLSDATSATDDNLRTAMFGCGILVTGLIVLAPLLAGPVIRLIGRLATRFGVVGDLARENTLRDPRRTAATAVALMISTALVSGLAVINQSTSQALDSQAAAGLSADYVISTRNTTTAIDPAAVQRVADVPGVRTASAVADSTLSAGPLVKTVSGVDPKTVDDVLKLHFLSGSVKDLGPGKLAVSHSFARDHHVTTGEQIKVSIGPGDRDEPYTVVGVYQDNPTAQDVLGYRADVQNHGYLRDSVQRILVRTTDGTVSHDLEKRLRAAVSDSPLLKVQNRAQLVQEQAGVAGDLMTLMFGLLAIGVLISALGMVNTLAMSVSERTREIGVLRAIGMDRSGIRAMIRLEAVCVAAFGTLLGMAGGLFGAWKVSGLANGAIPQYSFSLPWGTLALVVLLSLAVGAVAAALPARRAAALSPLEAVAQA
ncbi:ABC transporter permease [Streptomyces benahoarensis]|uniref:FtsX-like permease family protein n=1 Tax=Streptomyces benahoarensis TaxID=2595054 RepID=A0A553ZLF4_9ACTN|nr:FtsX-like permease family protein [Streptomyces benahoarensis]TSB32571.1 FtsX-like permease family protein [Streptomyces benahoarensis]TSB42318.1 FtsX-like permease family protein [Streptomyces benahoarensis]